MLCRINRSQKDLITTAYLRFHGNSRYFTEIIHQCVYLTNQWCASISKHVSSRKNSHVSRNLKVQFRNQRLWRCNFQTVGYYLVYSTYPVVKIWPVKFINLTSKLFCYKIFYSGCCIFFKLNRRLTLKILYMLL